MPLLEAYSHQVRKTLLDDINILYINHIISDSLMVARAFRHCGARLWTVGIPYGNLKSEVRRAVIEGFRAIGKFYLPMLTTRSTFSQAITTRIRQAILAIGKNCQKMGRKFLIVEDGGYAFPMLHDDDSLKHIMPYCLGAVEHTTRGMWNYQFCETDGRGDIPRVLERPALTIANSELKATHEPPFVAEAIIDAASYILRKKHDFLKYKRIAILGAGRLGTGLMQHLAALGSEVYVVDPDSARRHSIRQMDVKARCYARLTDSLAQKLDVIVGATGLSSVPDEIPIIFLTKRIGHARLILISGSSKQVEFANILALCERLRVDPSACGALTGRSAKVTILRDQSYGTEYSFRFSDGMQKHILFVADGYPAIFFPPDTNGAPNRVMDPIMSELFLAACLMACQAWRFCNRLYTLSELREIRLSRGPWMDLAHEHRILRNWCHVNHLDYSTYARKIGFRK